METFLTRRYINDSHTSLREDFDWDLNEISRSSSPLSARSEGPRHHHHHQSARNRHESRRKLAKLENESKTNWSKLRSELEIEKVKNREMQKEKDELRKWKENYEQERKKELISLEDTLKRENKKLVHKIKSELVKEKDEELQKVLKYKDNEIKQLRASMSQDELSCSESVSSRLNISISTMDGRDTASNNVEKSEDQSVLLRKMEDEIQKLKEEKSKLEEKYGRKCKENRRKDKEFLKMKDQYDKELRKILAESKKLAECNLKKLKIAELALSENFVSDDESVSLKSLLSPDNESSKLGFIAEKNENPKPDENEPSPPDILQQTGNIQETKRDEREKERTLQKKITELQTQLQRLERRLSTIRTENETLKQKQDDQKPLEEKIKALKKRNAELASIARRLEEKAKNLQQENIKKSREDSSKDGEHVKKMFARQRAKDLAEHAKSMLAKDRELENLRRKCHELADQISNGEYGMPQNVEVYEEKEELVNIIKQAAKERLQMEKQMVKLRPGAQVGQKVDSEKAKQVEELEVANKELQHEIEELDKALQQAEGLDDKLKDKEIECESIKCNLEVEKSKNEELESDLKELAAQNSQLTLDITHFEKRLVELEGVKEECNNLRVNLADAQTERDTAKEDVLVLQTRVDSLENLVRELHNSADQLHQLENDYQQALHTVDEKEGEISHLHKVQKENEFQHEKTLTNLKVKVQELENQCKFHETKNRDLSAQVTNLRTSNNTSVNNNNNNKLDSDLNTQDGLKRSDTYPIETSDFDKSTNDETRLYDNEYRYANHQVSILTGGGGNGESNLTEANLSNTAAPTESSKSLDTGFADEEELEGCNNSSPNKSDGDDPELYEIGKKLKELAVSDSDEDGGSGLEETEKEDSGMESNKEMKNPQEIALSESRISSLSRKDQLYVYVAKYGYDPYSQSPNEIPDAELPLNAGDYVLILGEMDEDGFYDGELVDGRKGLVPSNFIERVDNDHLADFHAAMAMAHSTTEEPSFSNSQNLSQADFDDFENPAVEPEIAYPRALSLDRQLSNCIYISWKPPDGSLGMDIQSYQVYVDGEFQCSVRANERTKALVENVDMTQLHRVCIRCITKSGHSSQDAQCTILVGKDSLPVPSEVKVSDITATSATINWLPGNTNYQHSVLVNGREASVVKPGVCKYVLTGLDPGTSHRIIVRAKNSSLNYDDERSRKRLEQLSVSTEFKTKDGGRPDQPVGVQVESGPQEGTLLLTWIPVSIKTTGISSSGGVITGYNIYIDGRKAKEAKGATNDHIILYADDFNGYIPKQISVRTVTADHTESEESEIVPLNNNLIKEISGNRTQAITPEVIIKNSDIKKSTQPSLSMASADNMGRNTEEDVDSVFMGISDDGSHLEDVIPSNAAVNSSQFVEPYLESSSSELSDIQEVEEEVISTEETNRLTAIGEIGGHHGHQMKKSPRPAPRKKSPSPGGNIGVKELHHSHHLKTSESKEIPAIEITRESSTEKSFEDEGVNSSKSPKNSPKKSKTSPRDSPRKSPEQLPRTIGTGGAFRDASRHKQELAESDRQRQVSAIEGNKNVRSPVSPAYRGSPSERTNVNINRSRHSSGYSGHDDYDDVDSISGEINPPIDDNQVRLFVALFDYDPSIMSPNVDFIDEELPFREGQIIKIYGEKDPDGFYRGECNNRVGFVPCNMVSQVSFDDPEIIDQLLIESQNNPDSKSHLQSHEKKIRTSQSESSQLTPNGLSSSDSGGKKRMVALYDYDPQELSPNVDSEIELSFKAGDIINITGDMDEDGFYVGEMNGVRGFVPSNFLQEAPLFDDEVLESASMVSPSRSGGSISTVSRQSENLNNVGDSFTDMHVAPSPGSDGSTEYAYRHHVTTNGISSTELCPPGRRSNNSVEISNSRRQTQEKRRNFE